MGVIGKPRREIHIPVTEPASAPPVTEPVPAAPAPDAAPVPAPQPEPVGT